jgi:hypothetical protein
MAPATSGRLFVSEGRNVLDVAWNASGATIAVAVEDDRLVGLWGMDASGVVRFWELIACLPQAR